jgi:hypothetical protein
MSIYSFISEDIESWLLFEFRVDLKTLLFKYNGKTSLYYKKLTTGNYKINGLSNHFFFKSFIKGFYRQLNNENGFVIFRFYIKSSQEINPLFKKELILRILKLGGRKIEFKLISEIEDFELSVLKSKNGINIYKKIFDRKSIQR